MSIKRWIEPEIWGRYAWTFLFTSIESIAKNKEKYQSWVTMIYSLPYVLPCSSCKKCCAKFLKHHSPTFKSYCYCANDCFDWLYKLKQNIRRRTVNDEKDLGAIENKKLGFYEEKNEIQFIQKFYKKLKYPELWYLDTFIFLWTVIQTIDYESSENIKQLNIFLLSVMECSPKPLELHIKTNKNIKPDLKGYIDMLISSPQFSIIDKEVFYATCDCLTIKQK